MWDDRQRFPWMALLVAPVHRDTCNTLLTIPFRYQLALLQFTNPHGGIC